MSFDPEAFDAFEAEGWAAKEAAAYDALAGRVTARLAEHLLDAVEASAGTSLLDVATGPGYVAERAVARGAEVVGLDLSEAMLEFARARVAGAEFVHGDATALPFEDSSFAAVTAAFVLLHLGQAGAGGGGGSTRSESGRQGCVHRLGRADARAVAGRPPRCGRGRRCDAAGGHPAGPPIFRFADDVEFARLLSNAGLEPTPRSRRSISRCGSRAPTSSGTGSSRERCASARSWSRRATRPSRRSAHRFEELLEEHRDGDGFEVPVAVKLGSGRKP